MAEGDRSSTVKSAYTAGSSLSVESGSSGWNTYRPKARTGVQYSEYLPPTNEVYEGYVFTGVCLSTWGVYALLHAGIHPSGQTSLGRHPPWSDTPHGQTLPLGRPPPHAVHAGIRSTSGRYPSHWNAFLSTIVILFIFRLESIFGQQIPPLFGL